MLRLLCVSLVLSTATWASEAHEEKPHAAPAEHAAEAHKEAKEGAPEAPQARMSKAEVKVFLTQMISKITAARGRCKPYTGKLSARDTENGCAAAYEAAAELYNAAPAEVKLSSEFQKVIPSFDELYNMKEERLRRAADWLTESTASKKKAEGFAGLKADYRMSTAEFESYRVGNCDLNAKGFEDLISRLVKIRKSTEVAKYCKWSDAKERTAEQKTLCDVLSTRKEDDETVLLTCLRRDVADWGVRRIGQDLRNLQRGTFLSEVRARKTQASVEEALEEKLKPWTDVAQTLELNWYRDQTLARAMEKHKEFVEAFSQASNRECVNGEEFTSMDSRAAEVSKLFGKEGAKVQKTFLAKSLLFEQNSSKEVTGRFQQARAVFSRTGDKHCWVASATYYSKHFGSDKWSPWSYTYDGQWLGQDGKATSVLPCRCK